MHKNLNQLVLVRTAHTNVLMTAQMQYTIQHKSTDNLCSYPRITQNMIKLIVSHRWAAW